MKNLQDLYKDYQMGTFNPKDYSWEWEEDVTGRFSLYIMKDEKSYLYAFDGIKEQLIIPNIGKKFGVKVKKKKC